MELSIVIPVYNEEASIDPMVEKLEEVLPSLPSPCEVLFVNDGSRDATVPLELGKSLFRRASKAGFSVSKLLKFPHGHGLGKLLLLRLRGWIDRQIPDPDWNIHDHLGLDVSVSSQEYTHRGALEAGTLPC